MKAKKLRKWLLQYIKYVKCIIRIFFISMMSFKSQMYCPVSLYETVARQYLSINPELLSTVVLFLLGINLKCNSQGQLWNDNRLFCKTASLSKKLQVNFHFQGTVI